MTHPVFFDIEADGLLDKVTKVHCIALRQPGEPEAKLYDTPEGLEEAMAILITAEATAAHNGIKYDWEVLKKLHGINPEGKVYDTKVMSNWIFADLNQYDAPLVESGKLPKKLWGSHSMEAWGYRLGFQKLHVGITDWSVYTEEMGERCRADVDDLVTVWDYMMTRRPPEVVNDLEHGMAHYLWEQEKFGFPFDTKGAKELLGQIEAKREELQADLDHYFPPKVFTKQLKTKVKVITTKFNPGSPVQRVERMESWGWNWYQDAPEILTPAAKKRWQQGERDPKKLQPKCGEEILRGIGTPEATLLADYMILDKRVGQISSGQGAWLKYVTEEGLIHGSANATGTPHGRVSHTRPNMAQVPNMGSLYGPECRALLHAGEGWKLAGCDASQIQLRALAHYLAALGYLDYADQFRDKGFDPHSYHQEKAGLSTRDEAKTFIYAYLFNAGDKKLGSIVGGGKKEGKEVRSRFETNFEGLGKLKDALEGMVKRRGYLTGFDSRRIYMKSPRLALNYILVSFEVAVMKLGTLMAKGVLGEPGELWVPAAHVHDEVQIRARPEFAEEAGETLKDSLIGAGVELKSHCVIDAEYKIGDNWSETH